MQIAKVLATGAGIILGLVVIVAVGCAFAFLTLRAWDIETCDRVIKEAEQNLVGYYITPEEAAACATRGLNIVAPVKESSAE